MSTAWKRHLERPQPSQEAREEIADALIAKGDDITRESNIGLHPELSVYQRYSGYFSSRHNDYITGHERRLCHEARDHGASFLMQIYGEQLLHVLPRAPRHGSDLFSNVEPTTFTRVSQAASALRENTHKLHDMQRYHGQRYREKASIYLPEIADNIHEMQLALRQVNNQLHDNNEAQYTNEKLLIRHCNRLLRVMNYYHAHATEMLPAQHAKAAGRD